MEVSIRTLAKMQEVTLDPYALGPKDVYWMFRGIDSEKNKRVDLTILVPGFLGKEYTKTYGHYHKKNEKEVYKVLFGEVIFVLQSREKSGEIDEVRVIKARQGQLVEFPPGFAHTTVNIGSQAVLLLNWQSFSTVNDYEPIKKKRGFAYYVVEKDGAPLLVPNPNYKTLPKPSWVNL
jgi:glucose-6-phosphate isomerase